jgi:hypothetical protein
LLLFSLGFCCLPDYLTVQDPLHVT